MGNAVKIRSQLNKRKYVYARKSTAQHLVQNEHAYINIFLCYLGDFLKTSFVLMYVWFRHSYGIFMYLGTLHHIAIIGSNLEKSLHFYRDILGFRVIAQNYRQDKDDYKIALRLG